MAGDRGGARALLEPRPWLLDAGLAAAMALIGLLTAAGDPGGAAGLRSRDALAVVLILAATLPYCVRRRYPLAVLTVATGAAVILMLRGYQSGALPFTVLVGAYTVGAERPARAAAAGAGILAALLVVLELGDAPEFGPPELVTSGIAFGGAILLGQSMRSRTLRIEAFAQQQEEAAQRAAADERLRIAQEMHDVVAHSLGVIAVQAGVGMHVIDTDPDEARRALENISRTSRASLAEIRRLLGLVRGTTGAPSYTPAPGLSDIAQLAHDMSDAGLPVEVSIEGDTSGVPIGVGLAAYRIVQEALSNALRHAQAHHAVVSVDSGDHGLQIEVCDDGRGAPGSDAAGHGLMGMRERVAVYGGSLEVGPRPGGGFAVTAFLPYDAGTAP